MPRPSHHGRPGTQVIPSRWEADHRPVSENALDGTAAVRVPGTTQAWDLAAQQNVAVPNDPYWTGPAAVYAAGNNRADDVVTAQDTETVGDYVVTVPSSDVAYAVGHLVEVTGTGDVVLDGRVLEIQEVVGASVQFERTLLCSLVD